MKRFAALLFPLSLALALAVPVAGATGAAVAVTTDTLAASEPPAGAVWLDTLDLGHAVDGWGETRARISTEATSLTLGGRRYPRGIGTHANGEIRVDLKRAATRFAAMVGVDDEVVTKGTVRFEVWADGRRLAQTPVLRGGGAPVLLDVALEGARELRLLCLGEPTIHYAHSDWAGAMLFLRPGAQAAPATVKIPVTFPDIAPPEASAAPKIHGPRIVGTTPGKPFLFRVPATGRGPLTFRAEGLPKGLALDAATGIVRGAVETTGTTRVTLRVTGPAGRAERTLLVDARGLLALTPPMGWNSWNCWGPHIDAASIRTAAEMMVKSGLAAHGYQYVVMDDGWVNGRTPEGTMRPTEKFGDMKALCDEVHGMGLKIGTYSSPGPRTCAGLEGSYQNEVRDAAMFAAWGMDYLKYDWCSYGNIAPKPDLAAMKKPYAVMRGALRGSGRDIVYSLCQYGMGSVWEWGGEVDGNLWRTTGDIYDGWDSVDSIGFSQDACAPWAAPGRWNDPDMLVVGKLGWSKNLHDTNLTPDEQVLHITLWSMLAAPLMIGCDLSQLDRFTLAVLCNDEVLEVDQDPLGRAARPVRREGKVEVWARPLWDGTTAVAVFNRGDGPVQARVEWAELGMAGTQPVRDLWRRRDLGARSGGVSVRVAKHGSQMLKVGRATRTEFLP